MHNRGQMENRERQWIITAGTQSFKHELGIWSKIIWMEVAKLATQWAHMNAVRPIRNSWYHRLWTPRGIG